MPAFEDQRETLRVMQVLVGEPWGGAERFFVKLAGALHKRGLNQKVIIKTDPKRADDLRAVDIEPVQLEFSKGFRDFFARRVLKREIGRYKPHVIMVWMDRAARRVPKGDYCIVGRLGGYYKLRSYKNCDWLIGNTPDLKEYIVREGWRADRALMISNFGELPPADPVECSELGTPGDAFVALAMGRLHPSKGFDTLIKAVAKTNNSHLWLAGQGDLESELKSLALELGVDDRVRFLGWRDDQAALLAACDVCVVPSRHEPLSNVVLEAWSLGVPVLATASEGPSWLIDQEVNGLLVSVDDDEALATCLRRLESDQNLRRSLGSAGQRTWQKAYSEQAICEEYLEFFHTASAGLVSTDVVTV